MKLQAPQIIYIAIIFLNLGIAMANHGKVKATKTSFWISLLASIITLTLLTWGGFFR